MRRTNNHKKVKKSKKILLLSRYVRYVVRYIVANNGREIPLTK